MPRWEISNRNALSDLSERIEKGRGVPLGPASSRVFRHLPGTPAPADESLRAGASAARHPPPLLGHYSAAPPDPATPPEGNWGKAACPALAYLSIPSLPVSVTSRFLKPLLLHSPTFNRAASDPSRLRLFSLPFPTASRLYFVPAFEKPPSCRSSSRLVSWTPNPALIRPSRDPMSYGLPNE